MTTIAIAARLCVLALLCLFLSSVRGFHPSVSNKSRSKNAGRPSEVILPLAAEATVETNVVSSIADPAEASASSSKTFTRELELLKQALNSFNSSAATTLVNELNMMRSNGTDPTEIDTLLNSLLAQGPDKPNRAAWTKYTPFARLSRRGRMSSLRRALDLTTPPSSDEESDNNDLEDQLRRRRRALVSLLRQLATEADVPDSFRTKLARVFRTPAICVIESKARREQESRSFSQGEIDELRTRMGQGLETPKYEILVPASRRDGVEIRQYQPFTVCSVNMSPSLAEMDNSNGKPKQGAGSFNTLAGYLFGKNQQQTPMKMTTPVLMDEDIDKKKMSFVLPSEYWSSESLPKAPQPIEGSGVSLAVQQEQTRAVVMFGGYASKSETSRRKEQLMQGLARNDEWEPVNGSATTTLSQYNDPFTPPWKRLNEVSIQVQPKS